MGLIGMMVKNAIVLVDEITRLNSEEGMPLYNAVIHATLSRVRPVMLASFTTIVGMVPLINDPMYSSLAVVVIGGLISGDHTCVKRRACLRICSVNLCKIASHHLHLSQHCHVCPGSWYSGRMECVWQYKDHGLCTGTGR